MLVGLGLVIFVHELGHFLVAKACGVKCEKFYLGFDVPLRIGPIRLAAHAGQVPMGRNGIRHRHYSAGRLREDARPGRQSRQRPEGSRADPRPEDVADADQTDNVGRRDGERRRGEVEYELDPRSFPAKSVPQRMAIISAGVIMNLIFAVIFAAIAYRMGVKVWNRVRSAARRPARPPGSTISPSAHASSNWAETGTESDHLRFVWDLRQFVAHAGMGDEPKADRPEAEDPGRPGRVGQPRARYAIW